MLTKPLKEIFDTDVKGFSTYDCQRSLPSGIDGFKISQRKIIFGMLKKYPTQEVKVSVANSGIIEISSYHHGSLESVLVNMAQNFPGSNNLPYLDNIGQFGSRISPAAAASRYIFTKLNENFKKMFRKEDESILNFLEDDGSKIEPKYYLPVLPNVLINGSNGTGTGFASTIFAYSPKDLRTKCLQVLDGKVLSKTLVPWYRGFTGKITKVEDQTQFFGVFEVVNSTTLKITELPIGTYTTNYRDVLNGLEDKGLIKTYEDNSNEEKTEFVVTCPRETLKKTEDELFKLFKLISRDTENFTVWTENEKLRKFSSAEELVTWFVGFRLTKYEERRLSQLKSLKEELKVLSERIRFIKFYLNFDGWSKKSKAELEAILVEEKFNDISTLMSIRLYNLTKDAIVDLEDEIRITQEQIDALNKTNATEMYRKELNELKI